VAMDGRRRHASAAGRSPQPPGRSAGLSVRPREGPPAVVVAAEEECRRVPQPPVTRRRRVDKEARENVLCKGARHMGVKVMSVHHAGNCICAGQTAL
jgi:hypothetical protein